MAVYMHVLCAGVTLLLVACTLSKANDVETIEGINEEVSTRVDRVMEVLVEVHEKMELLRGKIEDVEIDSFYQTVEDIMDSAASKSDVLAASRDSKRELFKVRKTLNQLYRQAGGMVEDLDGMSNDLSSSTEGIGDEATNGGDDSTSGGDDSTSGGDDSTSGGDETVDDLTNYCNDTVIPDGVNFLRLTAVPYLCIHYNPNPLTYEEGKARCESMGMGMGINGRKFNDDIGGAIASKYPNVGEWYTAIQPYMEGDEGEYMYDGWDEIEPGTPENEQWAAGEPQPMNGECVVLDQEQDFLWKHGACDVPRGQLCMEIVMRFSTRNRL